MKIVAVGDAYITVDMMREAVEKSEFSDSKAEYFHFGYTNRGEMRNIVRKIEIGQKDELDLPEGLELAIEDAEVLMVHLCPVTEKIIEKAKNLKYILCNRGGVENIDVDAVSKRGIVLINNPAHNANAVAEYTIGLMLVETRNIGRSFFSLKNGEWRELYPNTTSQIHEMHDLIVGIIGFGAVGRLVAEKLEKFNCKVLVYDPYLDISAYDMLNVSFVEMDELLKKSDIISIHARGESAIITECELRKMKKTAYLINTARSALLDSKALEEALKNKTIMGAAIDVFDTEPEIPQTLRRYDNLTITNHRGGDTINAYSDSPKMMLKNLYNFLSGKRVLFWYNKKELENKQNYEK